MDRTSNRGPVRGYDDTVTRLHEQRLSAVVDHLIAEDPRTVVDLGCGAGALLERLLRHGHLNRIIGIDRSPVALATARARLMAGRSSPPQRLSLVCAPITRLGNEFGEVDAAALVEVLEHLDPRSLSQLEATMFRRLAPGRVVITTPNREYNEVYCLRPGQYRHPHHCFEWDRASFERWASGVADRNGYAVEFEGVGPTHAWLGSPTQLAVFRRPRA